MIQIAILFLLLVSPAEADPLPRVTCETHQVWDHPFVDGTLSDVATVNGQTEVCARCCDCDRDPTNYYPLMCFDHNTGHRTPQACCTNRYNP